jgi:transketolase
MVTRALDAAKVLKSNNGITCRVVDMFSIKPIDTKLVAECARDTGAIVTAEEHNMIGGLGSAVAESSSETYPVPIRRLGVRDTFGESARDEEIDALLEKYGLGTNEIARGVIECRGKSRR